ncbi:type VI secretion system tip protein VgrG, partial [Roseateles sp. BYS180W]
MNRTLTLQSPAMPSLLGAAALLPRRLHGHESLGQLYRYTVELATPDNPLVSELMAANVPFKELVGKEVSLQLELEGRGSFVAGLLGGAAVGV